MKGEQAKPISNPPKDVSDVEHVAWPPFMRAGLRGFYRYGVAAVMVLVAFVLRSWLNQFIGGQSPFMVFSPAALLAARFAGLGPGLAALVAGEILGDYFFTPPYHSWGPYGPAEITLILTYTITTFVGVLLFHLLRRSKLQTEAAVRQARTHAAELEREVAERQQAEAALQEAKDQLSGYAAHLEERVAERTTKLQESLRSLESVLYHIAHDLRAPLRAMHGFTSLLQQQYSQHLDAAGRDYACRVAEAASRMDDLLQDLLEYGRVCHVEVIEARVSLRQLAGSVLKRLEIQVSNRKASLEVAPSLPVVWADAQLLELVLFHLLSNALKFTPAHRQPEIRLWTESRGKRVRLWIADNGCGIEPEHHERIFRIFECLQSEPGASGNGIGLAIVAKAMERMGGGVGLESTPGQGTRFWIELPSVVS